MPARTVLPRDQPQITRHLLPTLKTGNISHGQHKGHRSDRPHSRLRHQQPRFFVLLRSFHHGLVEQADLPIQHLSYPEQVFSPPAGPQRERQLAEHLLARFAPQLSLLGHTLIHRQVLQFGLHLRAYSHQLVAMDQQLPQILLFPGRSPDPRKPSFQQQFQNKRGIPAIVLLLAHVRNANLRRVSDPHVVPQCRGHLHKPLTVPGRLHPDQSRPRQSTVKLLRFSRRMLQFLFSGLSRHRIQPTNLLPTGVVITSNNHHRRLLSTELLRSSNQKHTRPPVGAFALIQSILAPLFHPRVGNLTLTLKSFNDLRFHSNANKKVIDKQCTSVLFSPVFACLEPRSVCTVYPACPELGRELRGEPRSAATQPRTALTSLPTACTRPRGSHSRRNVFRINTYKSLSKQTPLTVTESYSYKKPGGGGCYG